MIAPVDDFPTQIERDVTQAFGPGGMLARSRDFEYRPQQQTMAAAVAKACQNRTHLLVEAGTGVGKSLAYLVPAILHAQAENRKALVSTHTINLQEQLFYKDIPLVQKLLPQEFKAVLLKGRQNYLCPRRLERAMTHGTELFANREQDELKRIWEWSQRTHDGTLSDLDPAPDPQVWLQVCSEAHVCTPRTCGLDNRCFYQNARKEAEAARVVVLNHSLFFNFLAGAEAVLEERGYLFHNDFIIFDEAHTLEGVAARHLGLEISHGSLRYLLHRLFHPRTQKGIVAALRSGEAMKLVLEAEEQSDLFFDRLERSLRFPDRAKELRLREPGVAENTLDLPLARLYRLLADEAREIDDDVFKAEVQEAARRVEGLRVSLSEFIDQSRTDHVYWIERHDKRETKLTLTAAPIEVATQLRKLIFRPENTAIMTSATLAVGDGLR
jgi:ATP-dependent DNA helicase DinG